MRLDVCAIFLIWKSISDDLHQFFKKFSITEMFYKY